MGDKMQYRLWCGFFVMFLLTLAFRGRADDTALAKEKIDEGKRLIAEEKYEEALQAFEISYSLRPKSWVLFNIAMCNKALHRYVDAISSFRLFLRSETDPTSQTRQLAESSLAELESMVGKVRIAEAPDGAKVYIDGELVGETPLKEPLALDPGRHVVRVSKDRFKTLDVEVIAASGSEVEVRADLQQPRAELKVVCSGDKTVVFVDETSVGACPYQGTVEAGVHEVKVIEPGKETFIQTIEAAAGSMLVIAVDLKPMVVMKPPTFISDPASEKKEHRPLAFRAAGYAGLGLGAVSIIIGGVFTTKWSNQSDVVADAAEAADALNQPYNDETLWPDKDGWQTAYNNWKREADEAESFRNGLIIGYAVGGGLVAAGAALLIADRFINRKNTNEPKVVLNAEGVTIAF
jgi:hypothetical protein